MRPRLPEEAFVYSRRARCFLSSRRLSSGCLPSRLGPPPVVGPFYAALYRILYQMQVRRPL